MLNQQEERAIQTKKVIPGAQGSHLQQGLGVEHGVQVPQVVPQPQYRIYRSSV